MNSHPEQEAQLALTQILEVMHELFGAEATKDLRALFEDPISFANAPATMLARFQDFFRNAPEKFEPTQENVKRLFKAGVALERLKESMRTQSELALSLAGVQTLEFLRASANVIPQCTFLPIVETTDPAGTATFMRPAILSTQVPLAERPWEGAARDTSDALSRAAEVWYRPMLAAMLRLTLLRRELANSVPHELGKLMLRCGDLWRAHGGPVAALLDEIRLIRNSESHRNTEIDVRAETITFVNYVRGSSAGARLGPFNRTEFSALAQRVLFHCLDMHRAFIAVTT